MTRCCLKLSPHTEPVQDGASKKEFYLAIKQVNCGKRGMRHSQRTMHMAQQNCCIKVRTDMRIL